MRRAAIAFVVVATAGIAAAVIYAISTTGQEDLPGLIRATPTPDTRNTKDAAAARIELEAADPDLGKLIDAISAGDVEGVLALVDWHQETCGVRRDVHCGNAAKGDIVDVVNAGWSVSFFVPAEMLRPSIQQLLAGTPLKLRYAAQSTEVQSVYHLGFDGPDIKGKGLAPLADTSTNVTGLFVTVDTSRESPIVHVGVGISDEYSATKFGYELVYEPQRLITFDEDY